MKILTNLKIGALLLYSALFRKRVPLFVSWAITHRCNSHCKYCGIPLLKTKELTTKQVFGIIDELAEMGACFIVFTGGEPLLRNDIGKIVDYCKKRGVSVSIDSNGVLVRKRISDIRNIDLLQLSFDGPREVHDLQRGKGSYDKVIEAVKIARKHHIPVTLNATLSKYHKCEDVDYVLSIGKKYGAEVRFQPVVNEPLASKNVEELFMDREMRKGIFDYILKKKNEGYSIQNTRAGLSYLRDYPKSEHIKCGAFRINCLINPKGDLYPCTFFDTKIEPYNCVNLGFREAFQKSKPITCNSCVCNKTLDASKLFSLDPTAVIDMIKASIK